MWAAFRGRRFATVEEAFPGAQVKLFAIGATPSSKRYDGYERGNRFGESLVGKGGRGRRSRDSGGGGRGKDKSSSDEKE